MDAKAAKAAPFWSSFRSCAVDSLHWTLERFVEWPPEREEGCTQYVQPLEGAGEIIIEYMGGIRDLVKMVCEYLPRYACWVRDLNYSINFTSLIVRRAEFTQQDVLHLDVIGDGWHSFAWLSKWRDMERKAKFSKEMGRGNACGRLNWVDRKSADDTIDPAYFEILEEDALAKPMAEYDVRMWERTISGENDETDVAVALLSSAMDHPVEQPIRIPFRFDKHVGLESEMVVHVDYEGHLEDRPTILYLNLIQAHLFAKLE